MAIIGFIKQAMAKKYVMSPPPLCTVCTATGDSRTPMFQKSLQV